MSTSTYDVAVIGAGFTGANLAIQLMNRMPAGSSILLVGTPGDTGRGVAYAAADPHLLLNVRAGRLSLHTDDEAHFVRWLAKGCQGGAGVSQAALAQSYVSRACYGRYIRDTLLRSMERNRQRVTVRLVEGTVERLRPLGDEFQIRLASGERFAASTAALCLGNAPARLPLAMDSIDVEARARIIADPWTDETMRAIPGDDDVLFVGTGLTTVDQLLNLQRAGHTGSLTAISRHGLLPAAQPILPPVPHDIAVPPAEIGLLQLFRTIVREARALGASGRDWRGIFEALRPHNQAIWRALSDTDRRRFMRHLEAYWSVHRHRMAPAAAAKVSTMLKAGKADILAGKILAVEWRAGRLKVTLRRRGSAAVELRTVDWIVNCTGAGRYAGLMKQPLAAGLVERGIARPDRLRFGFEVDGESRVVARSGKPAPGLFALGPLTSGRFFEITAVGEIRVQVSEVADRLTALKLGQLFPRGQPRDRSAEVFDGLSI